MSFPPLDPRPGIVSIPSSSDPDLLGDRPCRQARSGQPIGARARETNWAAAPRRGRRTMTVIATEPVAQAEPAATARQEAFVRAELIRRLFEGSAQSRYFSFVLWPVIAAIYWRQIELIELAGPFVAHIVVTLGFDVLRRNFNRANPPDEEVIRWGWWFATLSLLAGACWGVAGYHARLQGLRAAAHAAGPGAAGDDHHGGADPLRPSADLLHLRRRDDGAAPVRAADLGRSVLPARRHRRRRLCRPSHGLCARRPSLAVRQHRARLPERGSRPPPAGRLRRGAPRPRHRHRRPARGRERQPGQVDLPCHGEPRDPHADERRSGHDRRAGAHRAFGRAARGAEHRALLGVGAAAHHRRHPGLLQDRGRPPRPRADRAVDRRADRGRGRDAGAAGGGQGPEPRRLCRAPTCPTA